MISPIPIPNSGQWWTALCAPVIAMAKAINGLRNLRFEQSPDSDWHFAWEEGGAVLQHPGSGGGGGGGLGPVLFDGVANGQVGQFLVNSDGVFYTTPPTKADGTAYPVANPD